MIRRLPHVDRIGIEERAASLGKRSIKTSAKRQGIRLAMSMIDLTTLEGPDTPGKVRHLAAKAVCPAPTRPEIPSVRRRLRLPGAGRRRRDALRAPASHVASVSTGFPAGQTSLDIKLARRGGGRRRRRRDRHGHLARGLPARRRRARDGRDRARQGGLRRRAPEGDPRDRRARLLRPRPPRLDARDGGRRRLHQDLDRQGRQRRDAGRHARDARGGPRLRRAHRAAGRHEGRRRRLDHQGGAAHARAGQGDAGRRVADARPLPHRRLVAAQRPADAVRQAPGAAATGAPRTSRRSRSVDGCHRRTPRTRSPGTTRPRPSRRPRPPARQLRPVHRRRVRRPARRAPRADDQPGDRGAAGRGRVRRRGRRRRRGRGRARRAAQVGALPAPRARQVPVPHRAPDPGARARAGRRRVARRRQADPRVARRRHPAGRRALLLLRGLGRQAPYGVAGRRPSRAASSARSCRGTSRC